ncbi:Glycogen synthase [Novipirellula galeiformis]|uniref:Glycogen synthase n=1 Tax=Novipirellula galeiformis TaxID=2528004 RepID=A0A5C6BXQ2_9BACT|nr:glycosyltransferase family 1 protein [Novipirellula galeiformis]TWU17110.1 Glycogen synthase [Novipirellula galeiformis]
MKIGIYLSSINRELGGGARFESEITQAIAKQVGDQFEFHLISHHPTASFELPHIHIPYPSPSSRKRFWGEKLRLVSPRGSHAERTKQILAAQGIDLLYSPHPSSLSQDIPFVVTCWDLQHRVQPFFPEVSTIGHTWNERESHYRETLPRAAAVITGTEQGKGEVEHFFGVDPDRICVIPFSVPQTLQASTAAKPPWAPDKPFIVYPAQFWPHKNHATIILALDKLKKEYGTELTAVFPGSSKMDGTCTEGYIESLARAHEISVNFPGFISDQELRWLYENAQALVFASLFGPDNLPPIEAMSLRCPVIASNVRGAEEQLGDAALRVPPTDPTAMASALQRLTSDKVARADLIERGIQLTKSRSMQHYIDKLMQLFDQLAKYRRCWAP